MGPWPGLGTAVRRRQAACALRIAGASWHEGGGSRTGVQDGNLPGTAGVALTQRCSPALSASAFRLLPVDHPAASAHGGRFQIDMRFDSGVLEE